MEAGKKLVMDEQTIESFEEVLGGPVQSPYQPEPVPIKRIWDRNDRDETVRDEQEGFWRIRDLQEVTKGQPVFDLPLAWIDLGAYQFGTEHGLISFARHMLHVNEASLDYPIIMDATGKIIDGRHRLVKALIEGRPTIKAVKVPYGIKPTSV